MNRRAEIIAVTILIGAVYCHQAVGQTPPAAILEIDVENAVEYQEDISDPKQFAINPNVTPVNGTIKNFRSAVGLGDIVAVNGQPAKGLYASGVRQISTTPVPTPGLAIGDIAQTSIRSQTVEILKSDGTPVGTIMCLGLDSGPAPPGSFSALYQSAVLTSDQTRGNYAIVGGTGAFLGARGQLVQRAQALEPNPPRLASISEDPANRRINGGGRIQYFLRVIPMSRPEIATNSTGPAIFHADFSPVSETKPAHAGEVLIVRATSLGPTVPGVDPGQPFPMDIGVAVNSPVEISVNGQSAQLINASGWPGLVDTYRIDFQVPAETAKGAATIQIKAAWIPSAPVSVMVQ